MVLGIIGGFFVYGLVVFTDFFNNEVADVIENSANAGRWKLVSPIAPFLAIAGGALSLRNRLPCVVWGWQGQA